MNQVSRLKNKAIAWLFTIFPSLASKAATKVKPLVFNQTPWSPVKKPLAEMKIALVTTAGAHLESDKPFNMADETGDPTYRVIPSGSANADLAITHDYYNHSDADKDINIVFPIERLREYVAEGRIGSLAARYYGVMGHILENHLDEYVNERLPEIARMMKEDGVDCALITPG